MRIKKYLFDQEIQETFSEFEVAPPPAVWYSIASKLPAKKVQKTIIPFWLRVAATLAILIGTSITVWLVFNPKLIKDGGNQVTSKPITENENQDSGFIENNNVQIIDDEATSSLTRQVIIPKSLKPEIQKYSRSERNASDESNEFFWLDFLKPSFLQWSKHTDILPKKSTITAHPPKIYEGLLAKIPKQRESSGVLSLGIYFSPQFSFRRFEDSYFSPTIFNNLERPLLSYGAGAYARFKLIDRLSVQIGIEYSALGQFIDEISSILHQSHFPSFQINPLTGTGHPQTLITTFGPINFTSENLVFVDLWGQRINSKVDFFANNNLKRMRKDYLGLSQKLTFLEVPVMLNLRVLSLGNASIGIKGGGGLGFLMQNQVFLGKSAFSSSIGKTAGLRKVSFFTAGALTFDYKINNTVRLSVEPSFRKYTRSMFEKSPIFTPATPFKYSISTGVIVDF